MHAMPPKRHLHGHFPQDSGRYYLMHGTAVLNTPENKKNGSTRHVKRGCHRFVFLFRFFSLVFFTYAIRMDKGSTLTRLLISPGTITVLPF